MMRTATKRVSRWITSIGAVVGSLLLTALPAFAQAQEGGSPGQVLPTGIRPPQPAPQPQPQVEAGGAGEGLAFTGAELTLLFVVVAALVILGTALYLGGRRRAARATA